MTPDNGHARQGVGIPCLIVDDLATAVDYIRDIVLDPGRKRVRQAVGLATT